MINYRPRNREKRSTAAASVGVLLAAHILLLSTNVHCATTPVVTTSARDEECKTEPFSAKVGSSCRTTEFNVCENGRLVETRSCPVGLFFNGLMCDLAVNLDCEPDPDCQTVPDFFSAKAGTGCRDYVYCENGQLITTLSCPDGLLFNGLICDSAENVKCSLPTTTVTSTAAATTSKTTTTAIMTTAATTTASTTTVATKTTSATTDPIPMQGPQSRSDSGDWHIYPAKFGDEAWCIYGDFLDRPFMAEYPRVTQETYPTFCDCCIEHVCHGQVKIDCETPPIATTAATTAATMAASTAATTNAMTTPKTTATTTTATAYYPVQAAPAYYAVRKWGGYVSCITEEPRPEGVELFGNVCECCEKNSCSYDTSWCKAETPQAPAVPTTSENNYYPLRHGTVVICVTGQPYPANVILSPDICQCCKKHGCTIPMDHCDRTNTTATTAATTSATTAVTTSTTATTAATTYNPALATPAYYAVRKWEGYVSCIAQEPRPEGVELFSNMCECCEKNSCSYDTSWCKAETTSYYYPVARNGVRICVTGQPPANAILSPDICQCCKDHKCTIDVDVCVKTAAASPTTAASPSGKKSSKTAKFSK